MGVVVVFPDKGFNASCAADGDTSGTAVLDDKEARFPVLLEHPRSTQFIFTDNASKLQEPTNRIPEGGAGLNVRVHLRHEIGGRNLGP